MEYIVKILSMRLAANLVRSFRLERPANYTFKPGQATEVSINKPAWKEERRPFTFTSLPDDPFLEFTIKRYPDHHGVTDQIHQLVPGDELILRDVWGAIEYRGPGYFIAGGAGITPFLAILRHLHQQQRLAGNILFFSNKTQEDIIYETELRDMLGDNALFILTREDKPGYIRSRIDKAFLESHARDLQKKFYVCGPDPMVLAVSELLSGLGAKPDAVIFEK